jgi:hypothetical protein
MTDFHYFGGIDFSGAREPLSNLWTAVGREEGGKLEVVALAPHPFRADLAQYVAGGWRGAVGAAEGVRILWGADFPFGLPADAMRALGVESWGSLLEWTADRPADEVRGALEEHPRAVRDTDSRAGGLAPLDLRLYKQTVEGLRWLHTLRERAEVSVLPQAPREGADTVLVEVYPSATARDLGFKWGRVPKKAGEVRARAAAMRTYLRFDNPSLEQTAVALEDAWDAVLACYTAWSVRGDLRQPRRLVPAGGAALELEGWIYRPPAALP